MSDYFNSLDNQYVEDFNINDLYLVNKNKKDDSQSLYIHDLTENSKSPISNFPLNHEYTNSVKKSLTPYVERQIYDLPLNDLFEDIRGQCQTCPTKVNTDCTIEEDKTELMNSTNQFLDEYDNVSKDLMSDIRLGSKLFKPIFLEDFWYNDLTERLIEPKHSIQTTKNLITSTIDMIVKSHLFKYFCDNNFINFTESLKRKCINITRRNSYIYYNDRVYKLY